MEPYQRLERDIGTWMKYPPENVVACSSGTAALHLAFECLSLPLGSAVLVPDFTMVACARAVTLAGLEPVFLDCRERDLLVDPKTIEEALIKDLDRSSWRHDKDGPQTGGSVKAILIVHVYGRYCNMEAIHEVANKYKLLVIEDMAEIHGAYPHPQSVAACYSFYRNKIVAGEEGGAVVFYCDEEASEARSLRSLGFTDAHDFNHIPRGHNYRLANLLAEPIIESLRNVEKNIQERRRIELMYERYCPDEWRMPPRDFVWVYDLRIREMTGEVQDKLVGELNKQGISARHGFKPMSCQREYIGSYSGFPLSPVAMKASHEVIYLPVRPGMKEEDAKRTFEILSALVRMII